MAIHVTILPPSALYISDPQQTELGKRILKAGILLMNKLGLENFTFRKLSDEIGSAEASIYRYFSNKNQLLLYLTSWYWDWVHYLVVQAAAEQRDPKLKLRAAIGVLAKPWSGNLGVVYIDQKELHLLVINEGTKAYRTKLVDQKNSKGLYLGYKGLTEQISQLILGVNASFRHPAALASSIFEMAHDHPFFARHLPRLTDLEDDENLSNELEEMLWSWTTRLLYRHQEGRDSGESPPLPLKVFVTRNLKVGSPLLAWAAKSGNSVRGRSLLKFREVPFQVPDKADWWFFYSSKAVEFCLLYTQLPENVCLAAQGEGTASTLRALVGRVDFVGQGSPGQVAEQFKKVASGKRVFFPQAKNSLQTVQQFLSDDIEVFEAICYDNEPIVVSEPIEADIFIFTSPLNVAAYLDHQKPEASTRILAIGGRTAAALYKRGYAVAFPESPSESGLVDMLSSLSVPK